MYLYIGNDCQPRRRGISSSAGLSSQLSVQCSNLGPLKKQRKYSPSAKQASDGPLPEALSADADLGEEEAYASSCSSDAEEESELVQELEEEVHRLHDQVSGKRRMAAWTTKHMQVLQLMFHTECPLTYVGCTSGPLCTHYKWEGIQRMLWWSAARQM